MKNKYLDIGDVTSHIMCVAQEMVKGQGEDACGLLRSKSGCSFAIFDGCGGLGAQKYSGFSDKTGAYVAAHTLKEVYFKWYREFLAQQVVLDGNCLADICNEIDEVFKEHLLGLKNKGEQEAVLSKLKGSMCKAFPTTAAIALCDYYDKIFSSVFVWAGDSRGYLLTNLGLMQVTKDDIVGNADALELLENDAALSNVLSGDLDFSIHGCFLTAKLPLIVFTASDGCFNYFPSPMHFENVLLSTLISAESYEDWQNRLNEVISSYAADDFSLIMGLFGFQSFRDLKKYFIQRQEYLRHHYIDVWKKNSGNKDTLEQVWSEYKETYYRDKP